MFALHDDLFPLTYAFTWRESTLEDVAITEEKLSAIHLRNQKMVQIFDLRDSTLPNSAVRKALADMSNRFEERVKKNVVVSVIVVNSKIAAGGMTALRWATGGWLKLRVCASAEAALAVCIEVGTVLRIPTEASHFCQRVDTAVLAQKNLDDIRRLGPKAPLELFPTEP